MPDFSRLDNILNQINSMFIATCTMADDPSSGVISNSIGKVNGKSAGNFLTTSTTSSFNNVVIPIAQNASQDCKLQVIKVEQDETGANRSTLQQDTMQQIKEKIIGSATNSTTSSGLFQTQPAAFITNIENNSTNIQIQEDELLTDIGTIAVRGFKPANNITLDEDDEEEIEHLEDSTVIPSMANIIKTLQLQDSSPQSTELQSTKKTSSEFINHDEGISYNIGTTIASTQIYNVNFENKKLVDHSFDKEIGINTSFESGESTNTSNTSASRCESIENNESGKAFEAVAESTFGSSYLQSNKVHITKELLSPTIENLDQSLSQNFSKINPHNTLDNSEPLKTLDSESTVSEISSNTNPEYLTEGGGEQDLIAYVSGQNLQTKPQPQVGKVENFNIKGSLRRVKTKFLNSKDVTIDSKQNVSFSGKITGTSMRKDAINIERIIEVCKNHNYCHNVFRTSSGTPFVVCTIGQVFIRKNLSLGLTCNKSTNTIVGHITPFCKLLQEDINHKSPTVVAFRKNDKLCLDQQNVLAKEVALCSHCVQIVEHRNAYKGIGTLENLDIISFLSDSKNSL